MDFTFYGHACFSVQLNGKILLFDPFITPNPLAQNIHLDKIKADYILISHGHADHIADAVSLAQQTQAMVISSWEICEWLGKQGISKTHPMNTGGTFQFDFGKVKTTVAQHSSGLPDGTYGGNPMGFLIMDETNRFYYSGDTALTLDMQLIKSFTKLNFAVLPIGDNFTMGYEDALLASDMIGCNKIVGVHYDTFGYIVIDKQKAENAFLAQQKELILPNIGETITIN